MRPGRKTIAAATAAVATAIGVLVPSAASAATDPGNPHCRLAVSRISESVDFVSGTGRVNDRSGCGGTTIQVSVERSRFWGWEVVARSEVKRDRSDTRVMYDCTGTGKHDFRLTIVPIGMFDEAVHSSVLHGVQCSSR
ncbi:hypothetical protein [Krasilnikovia sp. M28-CT-15]|uniref:hypothetical protein n=1 Tax=Krasilnikovia sp. M28-CT-15 TaxID=3373540 RepID=UPI003876F7F6